MYSRLKMRFGTNINFVNVCFLVFVVFVLQIKNVWNVTILGLRVPESIRNGSESGALLDCMYTLDSNELSQNSGLVVKWFFNRSANPVYQWIHNQKPQVAGILKNRLKLDYKASHDHTSMYRALKIIRPTIELSGEYKCLVSTNHDEDFMMKTMIVFVPERRMDFFHSRQDADRLNISCRVEGVYPKPLLFLYKDPSTIDNGLIEDVTISTVETRSGTYDVTISAVFLEESLNSLSVFDCELQIPGTYYNKRKTLLCCSGGMKSLSSVSKTTSRLPLPILYIILTIWYIVTLCWSKSSFQSSIALLSY